MAKLNTELYISRRISQKKYAGRRNVMVRIATATVAVSMAVMIIAIAVITGFRNNITEKISGFAGHVQIVSLEGNNSFETAQITRDTLLEEKLSGMKSLKKIYPYSLKGGIMKTDAASQGILLKGGGPDFDWDFYASHLSEGTLPAVGDSVRTKDLLVSRQIASDLKLSTGDRVEILFMSADQPVRRDRFKVSGIFETGLDEMDRLYVLTDIRNVQRLNGGDYDQITGYELTAENFSGIEKFADRVYDITSETRLYSSQSLLVTDLKERFPGIFDWLTAHNVNAAVIIIIMLVVSLLNMISAMLIILLERTRMIGILKSLGMSNDSLRKLFIYRSASIVLKGLVWGNIAGLALCALQYYTGFFKLDQTGYYLTQVPVDIRLWWMLVLNAGTFIIIVALMVIPASVVSRIKPEKTIRFQ